MKKLILAVAFLTMASVANAGPLTIQQGFGVTTIEGGNNASVLEIRLAKDLTNHIDLIGGFVIAGKTESMTVDSSSSPTVIFNSSSKHQGIYSGIALKSKNLAIASGIIYLDFNKSIAKTELTPGVVPLFSQVDYSDLSGTSFEPFVSLNASSEVLDSISVMAEIMTYELDHDQVYNFSLGAVFEF